jgi:hypothetical protein
MSSAPKELSRNCPHCQQHLLIPTQSLHQAFQCPRCFATLIASQLIDTSVPLAPLPVPMHSPSPGPVVVNLGTGTPTPQQAHTTPHLGGKTPAVQSAKQLQIQGIPNTPAPIQTPSWNASTSESNTVPAEQLRGLTRFGNGIAQFSEALTLRLLGYRIWILISLGVLSGIGAPLVEYRYPLTGALPSVISTNVFMLTAWVLLFAHIGAMRNDQDVWTVGLVVHRTWRGLLGWWEWIVVFFSSPGYSRLRLLSWLSMLFGISLFVFRNIMQVLQFILELWLELDVAWWLRFGLVTALSGTIFLVFAFVFWAWSKHATRRYRGTHPHDARLLVNGAHEIQTLMKAMWELPPWIDCSQKKQIMKAAQSTNHPLLSALFRVLSEWNPRNCKEEKDFQVSLYRLLLKKLPAALPQREVPIKDSKQKMLRPDIVVGNSILLEMKHYLKGRPEAERAEGQLRTYLRTWKKGPTMILFCDTPQANIDKLMGPAFEEIRKEHPVIVLTAYSSAAKRKQKS